MKPPSGLRAWVREHKSKLKRIATGLFVCLIIGLLIRVGLAIEWDEVAAAVLQTPMRALWMAVGLVVASYVVYSYYDLLAKWYTGHDLPWWQCMRVALISYAFTMNFSAAVGGLALRLRLYGKHGLGPGEVVRITGLGITTNWIGYALLAGVVFASGAISPPVEWGVGAGPLRFIGVVMMGVALAYVAMCAFAQQRTWKIREHTIELPALRIALLQLALAVTNWSLIGLVVYTVMPGDISYPTILGTFLIGSLVGAVAHIPGGLGVTEYVFITMLSSELPRHQILGAILVYRALYYIGPMLLAGAWYLLMEARSGTSMSHGTKVA